VIFVIITDYDTGNARIPSTGLPRRRSKSK
jgi:hypothetical protein